MPLLLAILKDDNPGPLAWKRMTAYRAFELLINFGYVALIEGLVVAQNPTFYHRAFLDLAVTYFRPAIAYSGYVALIINGWACRIRPSYWHPNKQTNDPASLKASRSTNGLDKFVQPIQLKKPQVAMTLKSFWIDKTDLITIYSLLSSSDRLTVG